MSLWILTAWCPWRQEALGQSWHGKMVAWQRQPLYSSSDLQEIPDPHGEGRYDPGDHGGHDQQQSEWRLRSLQSVRNDPEVPYSRNWEGSLFGGLSVSKSTYKFFLFLLFFHLILFIPYEFVLKKSQSGQPHTHVCSPIPDAGAWLCDSHWAGAVLAERTSFYLFLGARNHSIHLLPCEQCHWGHCPEHHKQDPSSLVPDLHWWSDPDTV